MVPLGTRGSPKGTSVPVRDDRIPPITRWVARLIVPFLAAACLVLYGLPGRTTELFAWTIRPDMTPVLMGAGYGAGVYFFYRVATGDEWHRVAPVLPGIAAFTWFMAAATVLHWPNFNRRTDPGEASTDGIRLPRAVRALGGGLGLLVTVSAVAPFVAPGAMIETWPWAVSPLTARILAGWFALFGVVNAVAVLDPRWSATRLLVQSQLIGVARAWGDFDPSNR